MAPKPDKKKNRKYEFATDFQPRIPKTKYIPTLNFFLFIMLIGVVYYLFRYSNVDKTLITAIIALASISIEMFSHLFSYALTFIQSIPYIGPIVAKVITWPIFITLNVLVYFVTLIVIRIKGFTMVKNARILTTIFLMGLLVGFILGRLF